VSEQTPTSTTVTAENSNPKANPQHVAIIMDGNGRWAESQGKSRGHGHRAGVRKTREIVETAYKHDVKVLTLFAFSSENWGRPASEVGFLMELFWRSLQREVKELDKNGVRLKFIGSRERFEERLQSEIAAAEAQTANNTNIQLFIAADYGGRADLVDATRRLASQVASGELSAEAIDEAAISDNLALADIPDPDLFIRTGGERRISNFLLWNLAYSELYFSDLLWPDFDAEAFAQSLAWYRDRQRRFGLIGAQISA